MSTVIPYVPESITVHLGPPSSNAANVTVSYSNYLKNVASSEIYPTWGESALRANILAINSFALNRIYTEFYRSRGYDFDITSSTAYDQSFVYGRNFFENISTLVDELTTSYIRRQGTVEPLAAKFCNGTTVTCDGLSQWGSELLAQQGYTSIDILRYYYGDDIELVQNAPVQGIAPSYSGTALRLGSTGPEVTVVQISLNRIAQNYPAIPKINPVDGIYGSQTEAAVRAFQEIFDLTPDGIVGRATWYRLVQLYVAVTRLAELQSEGQRFYLIAWTYPEEETGQDVIADARAVRLLQYMLSVISRFIPTVSTPPVNGTYDSPTRQSIVSFQHLTGLPETGRADTATWEAIYNRFTGIETYIFQDLNLFPFPPVAPADTIAELQQQLTALASAGMPIPAPAITGVWDSQTEQALSAFQQQFSLPVTGQANAETRLALAGAVQALAFSTTARTLQFPGGTLQLGDSDQGGVAG